MMAARQTRRICLDPIHAAMSDVLVGEWLSLLTRLEAQKMCKTVAEIGGGGPDAGSR
jgi:hypothetical protein